MAGDTHLAMFRVSKLSKSEESESKETEISIENSETTSYGVRIDKFD